MNVNHVNKHLPQNLRAQRGKRGHIRISEQSHQPGAKPLSYEADKGKFQSAEELARYAASKIPAAMFIPR